MDMEQMSGNQDCRYDGKSYSHGTQLCVGGGCLVCDDGKFTNAEQTPPVASVHQEPGERLKIFGPLC